MLVSFVPASSCQTVSISEYKNKTVQSPDSLQVYPEKLSEEQAWEKIVNFPGRLVFSPFQLAFYGLEEVVEEVDETKIIQRIIDYLAQYKPRGVSAKYSSRHGGGLLFYHKIPPYVNESRFDISAQWGLRGRKQYRVRLKDLQPFGKRYSMDIQLWHRLLSDETFFGIGNDTKYSNESNFARKQSTAEVVLKMYLFKKIISDVKFGFDINTIGKGKDTGSPSTTDLDREATLPGLKDEARIARLQCALTYNTINRAKRPTSGGFLSVNGGVFNDMKNDEFGFWKISASYLHYIHLFYERTISLRIAAETTEEFSGKTIPFYYLSELGESETIRGFKRSRFLDKDMFLGSLEYNYPVWRDLLDAGLFIDAGQVSSNIFGKFSPDEFHYGYGGALKIWGKDNILAQVMVGRSKDMTRYYFNFNKRL